MAHEKVHVICENLCLEEGMTKEQIEGKFATQEAVTALASGSPKGVYTNSAAIKTANPDTGVYIASSNGHIYSWTKNSTSDPIDLGVYQATDIQNKSVSYPKLADDINGIYKPVDTILSGTVTAVPTNLSQGGYSGKCIRLKNKKRKINGIKVWVNSSIATTLYVGLKTGDNALTGTIYFTNGTDVFEKTASVNIAENETNKIIEKYIEFDEPYESNAENLYLVVWGQLGSNNTWLNSNQSESAIMNFDDLSVTDTYKAFDVNYQSSSQKFYINSSWGYLIGNVLPAVALITTEYEIKIPQNSVGNNELKQEVKNTLNSINNFAELEPVVVSSSVKSIPNELSQSGYDGACIRLKNPKKPIYGVKVLINVDATTLYVGVGNGDNALSGTTYLNSGQNIFKKIASIEIPASESNRIIEKYIAFGEPIQTNDEYLFVGFWGWKGNQAHMLNCNLEGQLVYRNDDDMNYSESHPNYILGFNSGSGEYFINSAWTLDYNKIPVVQLINYDYFVPSSKIFNDVEDEENPLLKLDFSNHFTAIFDKIACIGDSLTEGAVEPDGTESITKEQRYPFSYPGQMQKELDNTVINMGHSGATAEAWLTYANTKGFFTNDEYKAQAYIIALGTNDIGYNGSFSGNVDTDIDVNNYNNNANTSVGNYAKIIQKIKEIQPQARIFVMTIPHTRNNLNARTQANILIREIAEMFGCYVIDLEKYYIQPTEVEAFKAKYYKGGHLNTVGYKYLSNVVITYIDYIIKQDPYSFWDVSLIGIE